MNRVRKLVALPKRLLEEVREWSRPARVAAHAVADLDKTKTELVCLAMGNTSDLTLWMLAAALVLFVPLALVVLLIRFRWAGGLARRLVSISWLSIKNQAAWIEWVDRVS